MRNVEMSWCLKVVLKSIFIFCVNSSIRLADKFLFHLYLYILYFSRNFLFFKMSNFFREIFAFFCWTDWSEKSENFRIFREQRNAKMKLNVREKKDKREINVFFWKPEGHSEITSYKIRNQFQLIEFQNHLFSNVLQQ